MKNREDCLRLTGVSENSSSHTLNNHRRDKALPIQKLLFFFTAICFALLSGCNPYTLRVDDVDYSPFSKVDHAKAAIQMSPATLYARETLINDRRREDEYLKQVLEGSKTKVFESEIRRELTNISALSARLGLAFDEGAREQFLNQRSLADAETELTLERLSAVSQQLALQQSFDRERLASVKMTGV